MRLSFKNDRQQPEQMHQCIYANEVSSVSIQKRRCFLYSFIPNVGKYFLFFVNMRNYVNLFHKVERANKTTGNSITNKLICSNCQQCMGYARKMERTFKIYALPNSTRN